MTDPNPTQPDGRHSEKMAELTADARAVSLGLRGALLEDLRDYADSLALERDSAYDRGFKDGFSCDLGAGDDTRAKLKAAEEKLRAAEGVVWMARGVLAGILGGKASPRVNGGRGVTNVDAPAIDALSDAVSAFDAINPDGSTGGPNPAK